MKTPPGGDQTSALFCDESSKHLVLKTRENDTEKLLYKLYSSIRVRRRVVYGHCMEPKALYIRSLTPIIRNASKDSQRIFDPRN